MKMTEEQINQLSADLWNQIGHKTSVVAVLFGIKGWHELVHRSVRAAEAKAPPVNWWGRVKMTRLMDRVLERKSR